MTSCASCAAATPPQGKILQGGLPSSFFQSSIASNTGERAVTLKKIDEIEAQMSSLVRLGQGIDHVGDQGGAGSLQPEKRHAVYGWRYFVEPRRSQECWLWF